MRKALETTGILTGLVIAFGVTVTVLSAVGDWLVTL